MRLLTEQEPLTDEEREAFLGAIRESRNLGTKAAFAVAGVRVTKTEIEALLRDEDLNEAYLEARGRSEERLRAEIVRRAVEGTTLPLVSGGKLVRDADGEIIYVREFSDRLLLALAKATLPEFRDTRQVELTGAGGGPVQVQRGVALTDVLAVLTAAGALPAGDAPGAARPALPAAPAVLDKPPDV